MTGEATEDAVIARDILLEVSPEADRYAVHAALDARLGRRGEVGFLWTLGQAGSTRAVRVRLRPDHPEGAAGIPILRPATDTLLGFRLCANITQKDRDTGKRRSWAREDLAPRRAWLDRRATEHGFAVDELRIDVGRCFIRKGRGFWIDETRFIGTLRVTDVGAFAAALAGGVGQRGAFGFGLLESFDPPARMEDE